MFSPFRAHLFASPRKGTLCVQKLKQMAIQTLDQTLERNYNGEIAKVSAFSRFINWCEGQQENRLAWLGIALAGQGCVFAPLTVFAVVLSGNSLVLFMLAIAAMGVVVVTNLAALPTKITIPVFFGSILLNLGIVLATLL